MARRRQGRRWGWWLYYYISLGIFILNSGFVSSWNTLNSSHPETNLCGVLHIVPKNITHIEMTANHTCGDYINQGVIIKYIKANAIMNVHKMFSEDSKGNCTDEQNILSSNTNDTDSESEIIPIKFSYSVSPKCNLQICDSSTKNCSRIDTNITTINLSSKSQLVYCSCSTSPLEKAISYFDQNWSGVVFSPFDKYPEPCATKVEGCHVNWFNYTKPKIVSQLILVSGRFRQISTYGMGTLDKGALPASKVPVWAAEMNKALRYHRIQILAGIFQLPDFTQKWVKDETWNAIRETNKSNHIFPQTVWGISVQANFNTQNQSTIHSEHERVISILKEVRNNSEAGVKVGVRLVNCDEMLMVNDNVRSEDASALYCQETDPSCQTKSGFLFKIPNFTEILLNSDFAICFLRPPASLFKELKKHGNDVMSIQKIVQTVGTRYLEIQEEFRRVNPKLELIGETGWPSKGRSVNESPNTLKNLGRYWTHMSNWGLENKFKLYLLEAFDSPWKNKLIYDKDEKNDPAGVCGSEASYGWWKRKDNSDPGEYIEKVSELGREELSLGSGNSQDPIEGYLPPPECVLEVQPGNLQNPLENSTLVNYILLGAGLSICGVLVVSVIVVKYRSKKAEESQSKMHQRYLDMFLKGMTPEQIKNIKLRGQDDCDYNVIALQFPYNKKKYELPEDSFEIDTSQFIGKGQTGTVFIGQIQGNPKAVAFKTTSALSTILDIKNLLSEIKILSYIGEHENIVCLLGAHTESLSKGIVNVALEYCELGSLDKLLQQYRRDALSRSSNDNTSAPKSSVNYIQLSPLISSDNSVFSFQPFHWHEELDPANLVKWAFEIANGMEYLVGKRVIHADLATRNILLTLDKTVKITDFGLSRKLYHEIGETFDSEVPLPWRWMPPESLRQLTFSTESDIWSYGITLWEIFSLGDVPYPGLAFSPQFVSDLESGMRMDKPEYAIINSCWKLVPKDRSDFTKLKTEFSLLCIGDGNNSNICVPTSPSPSPGAIQTPGDINYSNMTVVV